MKILVDGIERTAVVFRDWEKEQLCIFEKTTYMNNGNLAIQMYCKNEEWDCYCPYGTLTVNLKKLPDNKAFLDTNNNPFSLITTMVKAGYIKETGEMDVSGFSVYPVYEFSREFLAQLDKEMKEGGLIDL